MAVILLLILVSVLVAGGFLLAFLWSVKTGQMDDDYTPSVRILFEDSISIDKKEELEILPLSKIKSR
jgi:cbb3-type cytochrome oxidase maturation protein